jgi:hypothetical protein
MNLSFLHPKHLTLLAVTWLCAAMAGQLYAQTSSQASAGIDAGKTVHYTGTTLSNPYRHDGGLRPVMGTHLQQVFRADRSRTDTAGCLGWTYNHQPMLARWRGRFYLHFLSDPVSEHVPPGITRWCSSADGVTWTSPQVLFPAYPVPDGFRKPGDTCTARQLTAVMHQRVGWYVSRPESGRKLLAMGGYGICLNPKDDPNDGNGIGRVVREVHADGTLGPIYFLYLNHAFRSDSAAYATLYPFYTAARDKKFRQACAEVLADPLYRMQWVEEADRHDPLIPLDKPYKAFCYYRLPDDTTLIGLWKHALTSVSTDGGNTWREPVVRAPGFVNSNAKIWGQRLSDGTYATVYNPAEFRWPLALSTSADGLNYTDLFVVHGEISPMRYGGNYKSYGPQYPRGILPGVGQLPADAVPADGMTPDTLMRDLWVAYSVNKEDIWVARVPVPVQRAALAPADDDFAKPGTLNRWNTYSPLHAPVSQCDSCLTLTDADAFDYARAERMVPATRQLTVSFDLTATGDTLGELQVEALDAGGNACTRLVWNGDGAGQLQIKVGARFNTLLPRLERGHRYECSLTIDLDRRMVSGTIDGRRFSPKMLFAPIDSICRISFRTGPMRTQPTPDTPADNYLDLPDAERVEPMSRWQMHRFTTTAPVADYMMLKPELLRRYVAEFNRMDADTLPLTIANHEAAAWLEQRVPRFECSDPQVEQLYYYRWWTLRKHLRLTPVGYAMTEFLVPRSYADRYNLIACALGHHVMESRWLRDTACVRQPVRTWLRGNEGKPMERLDRYSSWLPYALEQQLAVTADTAFVAALLPDLEADMARWDSLRLLPSGLYWQADVQDGMEESISGGRRVRHRRVSINSYMYGNYAALSRLWRCAAVPGAEAHAAADARRAEALAHDIRTRLWSDSMAFYLSLDEAEHPIAVREAIGFMPWYVGLPDSTGRTGVAWRQLLTADGFNAPYGLTTAERRHPAFRTHGVGKCEWDGAVWPFATAQTLTALANYLNTLPASDSASGKAWCDTLRAAYVEQFTKYTASQHYGGRPYIGEYLDEQTGQWLPADRLRSRCYNHSTYIDLLITGLIGLRPTLQPRVEVYPLLPAELWSYFCLDGIAYHGHQLTLVWDADGTHYGRGAGFSLYVDGCLRHSQPNLDPMSVELS